VKQAVLVVSVKNYGGKSCRVEWGRVEFAIKPTMASLARRYDIVVSSLMLSLSNLLNEVHFQVRFEEALLTC